MCAPAEHWSEAYPSPVLTITTAEQRDLERTAEAPPNPP